MAGGRPSVYKPEFAEQAAKLCGLGATDIDLADFFRVHIATIKRWKSAFPEFCASLKLGKAHVDEQVERSLFQRAMGYSHPAVKIMVTATGIVHEPYVEHFPPDTTACIFWLKNRRPEAWRDTKQVDVRSGPLLSATQAADMAEAVLESARRNPAGVGEPRLLRHSESA